MQADAKQLMQAIEDSNSVLLNQLLKSGVTPNLSSIPIVIGDGDSERVVELKATPLMLAAAKGNTEIIELLLRYNADVDSVSEYDGDTALHWASTSGSTDAVSILLSYGANPSIVNHKLESPSALASLNQHYNITALLNDALGPLHQSLGQNDTMNTFYAQPIPTNYSPEYVQQLINDLAFAASNGIIERLKAILGQGIPVDGKNDHGYNALYCATFANRLDIVELLFSYGADVNVHNANGFTALSVACDKGHHQIAKLLVTQNANVNATDAENTTPILFATTRCNYPLIKFLLQSGANPNIQSDKGYLPLAVAAFYQRGDIVKVLLEQRADPNTLGYDGLAALTIAAAQNHIPNMQMLLQHNANPDLRNKDGYNALMLSIRTDAVDGMNLLLANHADCNLTDDGGHSPLMCAVALGKTKAVETLLAAGADIHVKDKQGQTALSLAIAVGHAEITELLQNWLLKEQSPLRDQKESLSEKTTQDKANDQLPDLEDLYAELNALIGMSDIKANVAQLTNFLKFQQMRKQKGLSIPNQSLHMVFTGNPGTGKTTIARLISKIYKSLGVLSKGQFVETDRSDLVAGFLGQTAIKTREIVEKAIGGVLFIDEAYSLTISEAGRDEFGYEAVNTLLKLMEDHRDDLIVIVAGYTGPMQKFIQSNPGLQSRFNKFLHFDDYVPSELTEIFKHLATQGDYNLHPAAELKLTGVFTVHHASRDERFGNARLARNLFEKAINAHANRVVATGTVDEASLVTLYPEDIPNI